MKKEEIFEIIYNKKISYLHKQEMLLLFELFSKEKIKKIVFLLSTIFMFSILNISAIDSEKIKVAAKKIEEFGQKSLCFEKDFLNKYLQSNYNFGELFENKMYGIAKNEQKKQNHDMKIKGQNL